MLYDRNTTRALADRAGFVYDRGTRKWVDPTDWCSKCGELQDDCVCEREARSGKVVTARKGRFEGERGEIRPGDRVWVCSGFYYEPKGPRTAYFRTYTRKSKGPAWACEVN